MSLVFGYFQDHADKHLLEHLSWSTCRLSYSRSCCIMV